MPFVAWCDVYVPEITIEDYQFVWLALWKTSFFTWLDCSDIWCKLMWIYHHIHAQHAFLSVQKDILINKVYAHRLLCF